jgi:hypothetical protein
LRTTHKYIQLVGALIVMLFLKRGSESLMSFGIKISEVVGAWPENIFTPIGLMGVGVNPASLGQSKK